jgi:hypothetical protein
MASVSYWFGYWMSASPAEALAPGDSQDWIAWPYNHGDAISISASPTHPGRSRFLLWRMCDCKVIPAAAESSSLCETRAGV